MESPQMEITLTADLHLTSMEKHPERFNALEQICTASVEMGIQHVIFAGDTFNQGTTSLGALENLLENYQNLSFHMIPGNHDPILSASMSTLPDLRIYEDPEILDLGPGIPPLLLIPYRHGTTMGEHIEPFASDLPPNRWYLISHGDWTGSIKSGNPLEPGVYMPLTQLDTSSYLPALVLLGHIHKPLSSGIVHYPGSPCGLDINETGHRSFIVLDTDSGIIRRVPVQTDVLYFTETLLAVPSQDEEERFNRLLDEMLESWNLKNAENEKAVIRLRVHGFTRSRKKLAALINRKMACFSFYKDEGPDLTDLHQASDTELEYLARETLLRIRQHEWPDDPELPSHDDILSAALAVLYGD